MIAAIVLLQQLTLASGPPPASTRFELPNGLRVWVQEDHRRPVALVSVTYKVGSINEQPGATGVAHYVEHMVYRATQHIRNEDIYGYIDRIGGRYTGGTWPEVTRYGETVPSWALESALRVTAERMCCALFDSTEFERERHNVITEANGFSDTDPLSAFRDALMYTAFEAHPYRNNSNTWARDNLVLTRDDAYRWYKDYYGPNNAVLIVVGDVSTDDVRRLVEKYFAGIARASRSGEVRVVEPPQRVEKRLTLTYPGKTQRLDILYHAPNAAHPDYPTLVVLNRILGMRLAKALSDSGSSVEFWAKDSASQYPYVYRISFPATDPERTLSFVQSHIERLGREGVTAVELSNAVGLPPALSRRLRSEQPSSGTPPRRSYLNLIVDSLESRETEPWEVSQALRARILAALPRVTTSDIQTYVDRWLRPSQRTVGFLVSGKDDFEPRWSDGRTLVGERMEIPPLTTPPAKRMRPDPVPAHALEPLAPIAAQIERRALPNGVVVRAARVTGRREVNATPVIRIRFNSSADSVSIAQQFSSDSAMRAAGATVSWSRPRDVPRDSARAMLRRAMSSAQETPSSGAVTVAIVGTRATSELLGMVTKPLAVLAKRSSAAPGVSVAATSASEVRAPIPGETQVAIAAGLPGVSRDHPDRIALELLNYIVGVPSYGGRLGWALTKAGLTYSSAAATAFGPPSGSIVFTTTSDTRNTDSVIQAIREVIAGVGARGVEEWELREAQAFTLGRTLLYGARDDSESDAIAAGLIESESTGVELLDPPALSRAYLSITLNDINRVAQHYYRPELLKVVATGAVPAGARERIFPDGAFRAIFEP